MEPSNSIRKVRSKAFKLPEVEEPRHLEAGFRLAGYRRTRERSTAGIHHLSLELV